MKSEDSNEESNFDKSPLLENHYIQAIGRGHRCLLGHTRVYRSASAV